MTDDTKQGGVNKALEQVIVKAVAGLMNARGGILLIGVADNGVVIGVEQDLKVLPHRKDTDGYANYVTTLLDAGIGARSGGERGYYVSSDKDDKTVCKIVVTPSSRPIWAKVKGQGGSILP